MKEIQLHQLDLNLLVVFEVLMDERSVARAADKLYKTPSAISHALGRLRDQLGDPLMVKVGGKMQPSPFADRLIEDIRPILKAIRRVLQPQQPFDPSTSDRVFRISAPALLPLIADVSKRVHEVAPGVGLHWLPMSPSAYRDVVDAELDLALGSMETVPEGALAEELEPLRRYTFARSGHPALESWNHEAWARWPHVLVSTADSARQTVHDRVVQLGVERRIGARVAEFSSVAPLVASTNMLANQLVVFLLEDIARYRLRILEPPLDLPELTMRFVWSSRLENEPGSKWLREIVMSSFDRLLERVDAVVREAGVLEPG